MLKIDFTPFPMLTTDVLKLRQLEKKDAEYIYNFRSDKKNFEFSDIPIYQNIAEAYDYIERVNLNVKENKFIFWSIANRETDKILGDISIWGINLKDNHGELGFSLYPGNTGKGIMSTALKQVINYGFEIINLEKIEAYTSILNQKAISMLEKQGFKKLKEVEEYNKESGLQTTYAVYFMLNKKILIKK